MPNTKNDAKLHFGQIIHIPSGREICEKCLICQFLAFKMSKLATLAKIGV